MQLRSKKVIGAQHTVKTTNNNFINIINNQLLKFINKDLVNIICGYAEASRVQKLLLKEFSRKCEYTDGPAGLWIKYSNNNKRYNYGHLNRHVFGSTLRFVGNRGNDVYNKYSGIVGKLPDRYYASLVPCDLMMT